MVKQNYTKKVFPNGVRLILVPMSGLNSVATSVMVACGSRYEVPEISGISHFLEHMVFKGTTKYPTTEDVNFIERLGGLQNAYTDIDITNYHNKVLSTDWKEALEINKELALKPRLEQKYVDKERDVILEEMKRYDDEPAAKVEEVFHTMMYPGTHLGMRTIGEVAALKATTAKELREYHEAWYKPSQLVVVAAGELGGHEATITNQVEEWFGGLKGKPERNFDLVTDKQDGPKLEVVTKPDASQAHLVIGLRTYARGSQDRFAWNVFNLLMGVSFTSRLFKEIREKKGLCYHIRSSSSNWADVGYWSIYAGVATAKVEEATRGIMEELVKAADKGVTSDEVAVAKKRLKTMVAFQAENPEFMGEYYGRQELFGDPILSLDDYLAKIDAVTKEDINRLLGTYLVTRTLNMSLVWNKDRDEKLLRMLKM